MERRLAAVITRRLAELGISQREASTRTGIPLVTLNRYLTNGEFRTSHLMTLADMLNTTASALMAEAEAEQVVA